MKHDALLKELKVLAKKASPKKVAGAFVASLGERPGFWRAPLVALAGALAVPTHRLRDPFSNGSCRECGLSNDNELEELHDHGQCLPGDLASALVVLRALARDKPAEPSAADVKRLQRLLSLIAELPDSGREGKLVSAIASEKLVLGNRYDRRHVVETLGACGILETPEHPGFTTRWTSFGERQARPSVRVECDPPIAFWTAAHGVSSANVKTWFGHLGIRAERARARSAAAALAVAKASAAQAKRKARAERTTELVVGDAVAFRVGGGYVAGVVTDHHQDAGGKAPVVELLEWKGKSLPSVTDLRRVRAAGQQWGPNKIRAPVIVYGLWKREDARGGWQVVGSGFAAPSSKHLQDPFQGSPSVGDIKKLNELAKELEVTAAVRRR